MSRTLFGIEKGVRIYGENQDTGVDLLFANGAPGGTTDTDNAGLGSIYMDNLNGQLYQKKSAGTGTTVWERKATLSDLTAIAFRSERVRAATATAAPTSGSSVNLATTPFTDDDAPLLTAASFTVGDYIIYGIGGTVSLMQVSAIASPSITVVSASNPIVSGNNFIVEAYLPDSTDGQELQALVHYTGGAIVKLADFNWALADGINLKPTLTARTGPVLGGDTVQVAAEKLEGDNSAQALLNGVARGSQNLGSFTGRGTIPANSSTKVALQSLMSAIESNGRSSALGVTTIATVDSVLCQGVKASKWLVFLRRTATPSDIVAMEVFAVHNATAALDATLIDDVASAKLRKGNSFNYTVATDISGTGVAQVMRLRITSTEGTGIDVFAFREDII